MAAMRPTDQTLTHTVDNQPGPPPARDLWASDRVLQYWARAARADEAALANYGAALGKEPLQQAGREANRRIEFRLVLPEVVAEDGDTDDAEETVSE